MLNFFFYKNKNAFVFVILISISTFSIANGSSKVENVLNEGFLTVSSPFVWVIQSAGNFLGSTWEGIATHFNADLTEKQKFIEEVKKLKAMIEDTEHLKQENLELKLQLKYQSHIEYMNKYYKGSPWKTEPAVITMRDPGTFYKTFIINKGSYHGIKINMPVIAFQNLKDPVTNEETLEKVVVGKIAQVTSINSKILPINSPNCIIHANIKGSVFKGFLEGRGNFEENLLLTQIDKMANLSVGDEIITSGGQSIFPKGIKIGRIKEDLSSESDFMRRVSVEPYVRFSTLDTIYVIKTEYSPYLKKLLEETK